MRILIVILFLSACTVPPQPAKIMIQPFPLVVVPSPPDAWEAATIRSKPVAKKPVAAAAVIPPAVLLPPCPPETGDKQKDLLRLLNCTMETADKVLPATVPAKK